MDPRLLIVLGGIAGAAALQGPIGESNAARRANDFRYTPDPRVMRVVAGAHASTFADLLWLRALPDMARPFNDRALKKRWIAGATEVITDLEPSFFTVYAFGSAHLNIVDKNPEEAIRLLTKGIEKNPDSAGLYVALAMVHYEFSKDKAAGKAKAIELLEKASTMPGVDSLSMAMLASLKVDARDDFTALAVWARNLEQAPNQRARVVCEYELWRTKKLIADRAIREFKTKNGRAPASPEEIRDPALIDSKSIDVVLHELTFGPDGLAHYTKLVELDRAKILYQAVDVVAAFREGEGRLPTEEEFLRSFGKLPDPGAGKKWLYADGKLSLVAE
jgi:hypothetical protein